MMSLCTQAYRAMRRLAARQVNLAADRAVPPRSEFEQLEGRFLLAYGLQQVSVGSPAIVADPLRNLVYISEPQRQDVLVLDTDSGKAARHISLSSTAGALAVSPDGKELYAAEGNTVEVFALDSFGLSRTLHLGFSTGNIAAGVNNRLYVVSGSVYQLDGLTGNVVSSIAGNSLMKVSPDGTRLAMFTTGLSSVPGHYPYYDISGDGFVSMGTYLAPCANGQDMAVDNQLGRIYTASGGVYGVGVTTLASNQLTVWPGAQPYGYGVTFNAAANRVFGANYKSIREYNRSDGTVVADYSLGWDVYGQMAATSNGHVAFLASYWTGSSAGFLHAIGLTGVGKVQTDNSTPEFNISAAGGRYSFDASASQTSPTDPITAYAWDFGDGMTGAGMTASHRFLSTGQYTVTLTLTSQDGPTSISHLVNVTDTAGVATDVTLEVPAEVPAGATVAVKAHVTAVAGTPTGQVLIYTDGGLLDSAMIDAEGNASYQLQTWRGTKTLVARYEGDATYSASVSDGASVTIPNCAPVASVSLSSTSPQTDSVLTATATKSDVNGDPVSLTFLWKVNGHVTRTFTSATSLSDSFDLSAAGDGDKGDTVSVEVTPNDGTADGATVIGTAAVGNSAPALTAGASKTVCGAQECLFTASDFAGSFTDPDADDALQTIKIKSLPTHGALQLGGTAVTQNQEIPCTQLGQLTYTATTGYEGSDTFRWTASDGTAYAAAAVTTNLTITLIQPSSVIIYSPRPEIHYGEAVPVSVMVTTPNASDALPTGTVTFKEDDGTVIKTVAVVNGQATCNLKSLKRGYHWITADYSGDSVYASLTSDQSLAVHVGAATVVDILAVYTPAAAQEIASYGEGVTIKNLIYLAVADTNDALVNSQINLSLELADVAQVNYTESGSFHTDLTRLATPGDGYMDKALSLRDTYGADLVCLFVASGDTGGLGYVMYDLNDPTNADFGFSVIMADQATAPTDTLAHELGHNFGATHDREHTSSPGLFDDSYGYRYTGTDGVLYHDIMSYDPGQTIPYYSNPDVSYAGVPTGQAGYSNVARTINASAPVVANYRPTMVPLVTPSITSVSLSGGVVAGQPITLAANVTGTLPNPHTPTGSVTFLDGDNVLGTATLSGGAATWTGSLPADTTHAIRALYQNDDYFGDSLSAPMTVDIAPVATVSLTNHSPATNDLLKAKATKFDADGDPVSLTFVWKVNGVVRRTFTSATALTDRFDLGATGNGNHGDTVTVRVIPSDGVATGAAAVDSTTVINTAPTVGNVNVTANQGASFDFTAADFAAGFADPDPGDGPQRIRITSLPAGGTLKLGSSNVLAGQKIAVSQLAGLTYTPAAGDTAQDSFTWNATDGYTFAASDAAVALSVNHAPTDLSLSNSSVILPAGTLVGKFLPVDPDTGNTFTYSLVGGAHSRDNGLFAIVGRQLRTTSTFNAGAAGSYAIRVRVKDQGGLFCDKPLTITLTNASAAPIGSTLPAAMLAPHQPGKALFDTLAAVDTDMDAPLLPAQTLLQSQARRLLHPLYARSCVIYA